MQGTIILTCIIVYLSAMIVLGTVLGRRIKNNDDFMVAGRSLGRLILTGTLLATWTGAGTIVGRANFAYEYGPIASIFYSIGAPLGIVIMYFFIASRVRGLGQYTVPQIMGLHYGLIVRVLAGVAILLAYMAITSQQFITLGYILNITTGLSENTGAIIGAIVIILLAVTGGLISVAYTDAISALVIATGLIGGSIVVLFSIGGFTGLMADLPEQKATWTGGLTVIQLIGYILPPLFLFLGDQNMYQRFGAAQDPQTAKRAAGGFFWGDVLFYALVTILASSAAVILPEIAPDTAILNLASEFMPLALGALILVAATAFAITTGSSYILSTAGNVVYDIYSALTGRSLTDRQYLALTRAVVAVLGIGAFSTGTFFPNVLEIQLYAYTVYGAAITPALLAVFFWRRATTAGATASLVLGVTMTLLWEIPLDNPGDLNSILFSLPISITALIVVSLMTRPPESRLTGAAANN